MRKLAVIAIIGIALFLTGFTGKLPAPVEGVYQLKQKTLTLFDLDSREVILYWNFAELSDSKPEDLQIEDGIDYERFSDHKFGFFRLGNNEEKVWFLMTKDSAGYWNNVYLDQNCDLVIAKKEKVKSFQTRQGKERGFTAMESFSLIPVSIKISYKGFTKEYEKSLYFFISTITYSKKGNDDLIVRMISASFLEGEMKVAGGKDEKLVKCRIIDADGNGCFNDYGKDLIYMDLNNDGFFRKSESQKLAQYFDSTGNEKIKRQMRLNLLPFSLKVAVTEAIADFDLSQLEPETKAVTEGPEAPDLPETPEEPNDEDEPESGSGSSK